MKVQKLIGLALLVAGGIALYFGFQASDSPIEQVSETLTGRYSDDTMLHLIGGGVAAVVGLALLAFGKR